MRKSSGILGVTLEEFIVELWKISQELLDELERFPGETMIKFLEELWRNSDGIPG